MANIWLGHNTPTASRVNQPTNQPTHGPYLSTTLIHITSSIVENPQHGHNTVARSVRPTNIGLRRTNIGNTHANATGIFGNDGTVLERIVNAINGILLHAHEKARAHLRIGSAGIEERRRGVREVAHGKEVVRLNDTLNVVSVNADADAHEHVLRTFGNVSIQLEEITLFERFESKIVEFKVTIVNDGSIQLVLVSHDDVVGLLRDERSRFSRLGVNVGVKALNDFGKDFLRHFVEIRDGNASCEDGAIGMLRGKGRCRLSGKSVGERGECEK